MPGDMEPDSPADAWHIVDNPRGETVDMSDVDGITERMMTVSIPDSANIDDTTQDRPHGAAVTAISASGRLEEPNGRNVAIQDTADEAHLTFQEVESSGPATPPIPFDPPSYFHATRAAEVLVYDENTSEHFVAKNVLFRNNDSDVGGSGASREGMKHAYWRIPNKAPIETRMGHLEISIVLKLCPKSDDTDTEDEHDDSDEEEDIVFLLTNEYVAVKVNYCQRMERMLHLNAENPLNEIAAQKIVGNDNPHVLGVKEVLYDGENLNVVMPYCGGGDIFDTVDEYLKAHPREFGLPEAQARFWFRQLTQGMLHIQRSGICHRDLSPENVIVTGDRCLVIDLGMSLRVPFNPRAEKDGAATDITRGTTRRLITPQGQCGKRRYMSPEIWRNKDDFDGFSIDVWTGGMILFFMLTGQTYLQPFDQIFRCVTTDLPALLRHWGMNLSGNVVDLLQGMLAVDPRNRLTLGQVIAHPWVAG